MNPLLLNYHDACIYKSDLRLVESPTEWLNDACINFQMTRLQQKRSATRRANECGGGPLLFLDPAVVSYMMHQCDEDDLADLGRSWGTDLQRMVDGDHSSEDGCRLCGLLVPVNDHNAAAELTVGGGNHWSMLLVVLSYSSHSKAGEGEKCVVDQLMHFDSHGRCNATAAQAVSSKICRAFSLCNDNNATATPPNKVTLTHCSTPQQTNGHDCGIFALGAAEALSEHWRGGNIMAQDMENALKSFVSASSGDEFAKTMRQKIGQDIRDLAGMTQ